MAKKQNIVEIDWKSFKNLKPNEIAEMISASPDIFRNLIDVMESKMKLMRH